MTARVTLDGNSISEQYSIEPVSVENIWLKNIGGNYNKPSVKDAFYEERIFSSKGGYLDPKYIIKDQRGRDFQPQVEVIRTDLKIN